MSEATKAVFLSYASQDAEAAKRIAEALRSSGVEVWFDAEGGLETGDEWDAKIRRQIKECVLFIPIISANTQAREEGYFRIEWDLAAERARGIASGVAFILPVVIDDTREADALVPDRFCSVQWTRLPGGEVTPEVKARFLKLWSHRAGMAKQQQQSAAPASVSLPAPAGASDKPRGISKVALGLVAVAAVAGIFFLARPRSGETAKPPTTTAVPVAAGDFPRDPDLRRARSLLFTLDAIPEDFLLAEDILKPVLAQRPNDPEVVTVAAEINQEFLSRGFDTSPARRAQAQRLAERAVQLSPDNPHALGTMARYLLFIGGQLTRAEELIRKAISLQPDEARFHRALHYILFLTRPAAETDAYGERMAEQFPRDPLVTYDIARRFKDSNDVVQMEKWFDRTLERDPNVAFALIWKAWIAVRVHGDLVTMKQLIDRVPERQRNNTRVVNARYTHAMLSGDTREALQALNQLADEWLTDFNLTVPKTLMTGNLAQLEGRKDLARSLFEAALATSVAEAAKNPNDVRPRRAEMWSLIGLGRLEEARAIQRIFLQSLNRPFFTDITAATWANPIISCLLLDLRTDALSLLRDSSGDANCRRILRNMFKLDPRLAPWREDPEITALLAEPRPVTPAATSVPGKSIAVLPFANLSADKENEFFADGMHDDLITALAKVRDLKVISRTSVLPYKTGERNLRQIAAQLGVAHILEGSVQRSGPRVRLNVQLIDARNDTHLWAETYNRELTDIFALQAALTQEIAGALKATLTPGERSLLARRPTENQQAYDLYLRARILEQQLPIYASRDEYERIVSLYEQAAALDPSFMLAHAQVSVVHGTMFWFGHLDPTPARREQARGTLEKAQALAPGSPEVLLAEATFEYTCNNRWRRALDLYLAAEAGLPNDSQLLYRIAIAHRRLGEHGAAVVRLERCVELNPYDVRAVSSLIETLMNLRRYPEVIAAYQRHRQLLAEDHLMTRVMLLSRHQLDGDWAAFVRAMAAVPPRANDRHGLDAARQLALNAGDFTAAEGILADPRLQSVQSLGGVINEPVALHQAELAWVRGRKEPAAGFAAKAQEALRARTWTNRQQPYIRMAQARALAYAGRADEAVAEARSALAAQEAMDQWTLSFTRHHFGQVLVAAGRTEEALEQLRVILRSHGLLPPIELRHDPVWSRLKDDPRFEEVLRSWKPQ